VSFFRVLVYVVVEFSPANQAWQGRPNPAASIRGRVSKLKAAGRAAIRGGGRRTPNSAPEGPAAGRPRICYGRLSLSKFPATRGAAFESSEGGHAVMDQRNEAD